MVDQIYRQAATTLNMGQASNSEFSIIEIEDRYLWSIQANREHDLRGFAQAVFAETVQLGSMLTVDSLRLIHLWPHKAYLMSAQPSLPGLAHEFSPMMTDIGHGFCELSLAGDDAFEFLGTHTSADLMDTRIAATRNLRCMLGQYQVILWWDQVSDIRILVDRSYAQSICDYLGHLMQRWS